MSGKSPYFLVAVVFVLLLGAGGWVSVASPLSGKLAAAVSATMGTHDKQVKADLATIAAGLEKYYADHGSYVVPGTGFGGEGQGWFATGMGTSSDAYYTVPILQKLQSEGYLPSSVKDKKNYMLYVCDSGQTFALSATLESPSAADITKQKGSCNAKTSGKFKKNFVVTKTHRTPGIPTTTADQVRPYCKFTLADRTLTPGQAATLSWKTKRATVVVLQSSQLGTISTVAASSSLVIVPIHTTTYTLIAINDKGVAKCSVTATVQ